MKKLILTLICLATLILPTQAQKYYFLHSDETGNYYYEDENPLSHRERKFRLKDAQEATITITNIITKPDWILRLETLYTNGLVEVSHPGAHTNMNNTFEMIGIDLLERIVRVNNPNDAAKTQKWKTVLESAYTGLGKYAAAFGIEDMRQYPYDTDIMLNTTSTVKVITFRGIQYYKKD